MHAVKDIVCLRKVNFKKLLAFGFEIYGDAYTYTALLPESGFLMHVKISEQGEVFTEVLDPTTDEPYTLHLLENVSTFIQRPAITERAEKLQLTPLSAQ